MTTSALVATLVAGTIALAACSAAPSVAPVGASTQASASDPVQLEPVEVGPREDVPSALDSPVQDGLPAATIDLKALLSGGVPPDGIPAIDQPTFEVASNVTWLDGREPVVALELNGQHRAYPVQVMTWHEIVNDTVDGTPIVVTYCPLCNTALAFNRVHGDRLLSFGVSGMLYNSDLVMYDRQTESLWSQIEGGSIAGFLAGDYLEFVPVTMRPWAEWSASHPDGWVLSRDTGVVRDYGRNPYVGYDEVSSGAWFPLTAEDGRLEPKERIVAFPAASEAVAVVTAAVAELGAIQTTVDGEQVVIVASAGLASALDTAGIAEGRAVSWTTAFYAKAAGRELTFTAQLVDGSVELTDAETGSRWNLSGEAIAGELAGTRLQPVPIIDTFWFAWAAFNPDVRLVVD